MRKKPLCTSEHFRSELFLFRVMSTPRKDIEAEKYKENPVSIPEANLLANLNEKRRVSKKLSGIPRTRTVSLLYNAHWIKATFENADWFALCVPITCVRRAKNVQFLLTAK